MVLVPAAAAAALAVFRKFRRVIPFFIGDSFFLCEASGSRGIRQAKRSSGVITSLRPTRGAPIIAPTQRDGREAPAKTNTFVGQVD